jgi:hypothetical protein
MAFALSSYITITSKASGKVIGWSGVHSCRIKKSVSSYVDTCTLTLPASMVLNDNNAVSNVTVLDTFKRGDAIKVQLGYDGKLETEFEGFISDVSYTTPVVIECEGYSFLLKTKNINRSWKTATVRELCEFITKDTGIKVGSKEITPGIKLSDKIVQTNLTNFKVSNATGTQVLDKLKEQLKYSVYFIGNVLYVGLEELETSKKVTYKLGWNTAGVNSLKYKLADDRRVKIVCKTTKEDGNKEVYTIGDADGGVQEMIVKNANIADAKKAADALLARTKFTGFEGVVEGFLVPYAHHGYTCEIIDTKFKVRSGKFFTAGVEINFGMNGARRNCEITYKLSV